MHCVHIAYPRVEGASFDLTHYVDVHVPMGLGLLWKHFEIKPTRVLLQQETYGPDRTAASAPFDLVATMVFENKADADRFIDVFENPEAAGMLQADWPRFTQSQPLAVLGELTELDVDRLLAAAEPVLASGSSHD